MELIPDFEKARPKRGDRFICPCCGEERRLSKERTLLRTEAEMRTKCKMKYEWMVDGVVHTHPYWDERALIARLSQRSNSLFQWACDVCMREGWAIEAQPWKQIFLDHDPYFAFFDRDHECKECGSTFVFTAKEQQRYYEELGIWVQAIPTRCPPCRRNQRQKAKIQRQIREVLERMDPNDPQDHERLATLYEENGSLRKAAIHSGRARRLRAFRGLPPPEA